MNRVHRRIAVTGLCLALLMSSCAGCEPGVGTADLDAGLHVDAGLSDAGDVTDAGPGGDTDGGLGAAGDPCAGPSDCDALGCFNGVCCGALEQVCGGGCCPTEAVCLFDACVVGGDACRSEGDCGENEYCESSFGGDGGTSDADAGICVQALPQPGRCVALPEVCPDGGTPSGCVPACEYRPAVAQLDAVRRWHWMPTQFPDFADVWSTPTVGRIYDGNCDGRIDELDPPSVVFVSGDTRETCCQCTGLTPSPCKTGVLRMVDGRTGRELWSLERAEPSSVGWAAMSLALGDVDRDGRLDIVAVTGEGKVAVVDGDGKVISLSTDVLPGNAAADFGWGGGLSLGDIDNDGVVEVAFGATVMSMSDAGIQLRYTGVGGTAGAAGRSLSTLADLDGDGTLELFAARTSYRTDGGRLWHNTALPNAFPGVGDFDRDGLPEGVVVGTGQVWIVRAATGEIIAGPLLLPSSGSGGPPTVADFDGDGLPEIGVAQQDFYFAVKVDMATAAADGGGLSVLWQTPNHDFSSSITGSTVFDFEGDGAAEVVYNDECFLWVFDGTTGAVRFATPTTSFTGTEASLVADVDGDGSADMLMISNGVDPSAAGWDCDVAPWNQPDPLTGRPAWAPPEGQRAWRGLSMFSDRANGWVGTRTLWNQHTYHVTNICDDRDSACFAGATYGSIPPNERSNWGVPWLNNFRQNVLEGGLFNAPDATVVMSLECGTPIVGEIAVRNLGLRRLPAGVEVAVFAREPDGDVEVWRAATTSPLNPGQSQQLSVSLTGRSGGGRYIARVLTGTAANFRECRDDNNASAEIAVVCIE